MNLQESIDRALALTREMQESLRNHRVEAWADILARRDDAMTVFRETHLAADAASLASCHASLVELAAADRRLQSAAREALRAADADVLANLGAAPTGSSAYDDTPLQGAVNRRA